MPPPGAPPAPAPGTPPAARTAPGGPGGMRGGPGGILGSPTPSAELTALLKQDAGSYTWVAAAVGSNNAAGYQLAVDAPVMAIGGFNGTDPAPTLAQFQALVAQRRSTGSSAAARRSAPAAQRHEHRRQRRRRPDRGVGAGELHRHHGRRHHGLRPEREPARVSTVTPDRARSTARRTGSPQGAGQRRHRRWSLMSIDSADPDLHAAQPPVETDRVVLDVVVPVYNEEGDLETVACAGCTPT